MKSEKEIDREHLESDLGTAAFLVVRRFRLLGLMPNGGGRYAFRFDDPDGTATEEAMEYLQGASVPAKALVSAERDLKTLLYSRKRDGNGRKTTYRK